GRRRARRRSTPAARSSTFFPARSNPTSGAKATRKIGYFLRVPLGSQSGILPADRTDVGQILRGHAGRRDGAAGLADPRTAGTGRARRGGARPLGRPFPPPAGRPAVPPSAAA